MPLDFSQKQLVNKSLHSHRLRKWALVFSIISMLASLAVLIIRILR